MMMIAMQTAVIRRQIGKSLPLFFSAKILVWLNNRVIHSMQEGMFGPAQH
jgi:hypothetical protein